MCLPEDLDSSCSGYGPASSQFHRYNYSSDDSVSPHSPESVYEGSACSYLNTGWGSRGVLGVGGDRAVLLAFLSAWGGGDSGWGGGGGGSHHLIYPLTAKVVGAPQMILQPVSPIFSLFSTAHWDLANSRPVYSLMLSSHLFFRLPSPFHCV